jgi:hypothetical protein
VNQTASHLINPLPITGKFHLQAANRTENPPERARATQPGNTPLDLIDNA